MQKLAAQNLVAFIIQLPKDRIFNYVHPGTKTQLKIVRIESNEGLIIIKRWGGATNSKTEKEAKEESISTQLLWRIANAFEPELPINFDRILGGSYNTRSSLEALLAHSPEFYFSKPGRIEDMDSRTEIKPGHKHLIWRPDDPHKPNVITEHKTTQVISELPAKQIVYDSVTISSDSAISNPGIDIETKRRHIQIQIALYQIGLQLGYRTWIARNDQGNIYKGKTLREYDGMLKSLKDGVIISPFNDVIQKALLIDCIWFKNGKLMPAVMEVEHSTGVTTGLTRMLDLKQTFPSIKSKWVIVADESERNKVIQEANREQFRELDTRFLPYSGVEELLYLCQKRNLKGITDDFFDCYMESVVED